MPALTVSAPQSAATVAHEGRRRRPVSPSARRARRLATIVAVGVGLSCAAPGTAGAAVDGFINIPGYPGESTDATHQKWIQFEDASFKFERATRTTAPAFAPLTLTKRVDSTTPRFLAAVGSGTVISNAWIALRKAGEATTVDYFRMQLSNVVVLSHEIDFAGGDVPIERISLSFTRAVESYQPLLKDGSMGTPLTLGWSTFNQTPYNVFTEPPMPK